MKHGIYVELDALLDTRLVTVAKIDPEAGAKLVDLRSYYERLIDDFSEVGVDRQKFLEAYRRRDIETLKYARMTGMVVWLAKMVMELEIQSATTPFITELKVEINTYPYDLDEETRRAIGEAVSYYVGKTTPIAVVYYPPEMVDPEFCRKRYGAMMMYDANDWIRRYAHALSTHGIPQVTMIAPALYHERIPHPDEVKIDSLPGLNPFALAERGLSEAIRLELISVDSFCMIRE